MSQWPRTLQVTYPFDAMLSKNKMWRRSRFGSIYLANRQSMNRLALFLSNAKSTQKFKIIPNIKLHVAIMVFKPSNRCDASNFVDTINDAVSKSLYIDDRWFSGSYDWGIDKIEPRFEITITQ